MLAGYPLIGNLLDIPQQHSWLKFREWADEYGPIYRIRLGRQEHVIISTEKIANELLRERGSYYSSREQTVMAAELLSGNLRPLLLPYNGRIPPSSTCRNILLTFGKIIGGEFGN